MDFANTLQSGGDLVPRSIPCYICDNNNLVFYSYTPKEIASGPLEDAPACIAADELILNLQGAQFFEVMPASNCVDSGAIRFQEVELQQSDYPYHHGGYVLPDFGDEFMQTFYVCKACVPFMEGECPHTV